jgi:hypothetical protein
MSEPTTEELSIDNIIRPVLHVLSKRASGDITAVKSAFKNYLTAVYRHASNTDLAVLNICVTMVVKAVTTNFAGNSNFSLFFSTRLEPLSPAVLHAARPELFGAIMDAWTQSEAYTSIPTAWRAEITASFITPLSCA